MLLLSSFTTQSPFHSPKSVADAPKLHHSTAAFCRASTVAVSATATSSHKYPPLLSLTAANASSSSLANGTSESLRHVGDACAEGEEDGGEPSMVPSASAVASAIRRASNSPVEFEERIEKEAKNKGLVLPSHDFRRLCLEQLDLFRRVVDPDAVISVYVRPAGSYVMDRLELRRVTFHPGVNASAEILILLGNFSIPTGLRAAEAILSNQQAEFIPEYRAVVLPMVKHPFVVGFLVAELPKIEIEKECHDHDVKCPLPEELYAQPSQPDSKSWEIRSFREKPLGMFRFTAEQRLNAVNICHSIAMAYVMDQKAMLLQQSSWQNNVRMSTLVEQIRGPLSSIRTLSKLLSVQIKRSEISSDIVEDILVQGDRIRDTLEQLQDAVYLTKANIMRFNEETLKKMHQSAHAHPESVRPHLPSNTSRETSISKMQESAGSKSVTSKSKDLELPMPPLALAPLQPQGVRRPSDVSDILADLVGAVKPLAHRQQRIVELCEVSTSLSVAVEEPALRQALSNLIEGALLRTHVGGKVEIVSTGAPAGGALVIIDDDGPDMHYMTQMHSLTPFGSDLFSSDMIEDNMTWNFVAGLTVAREILESYGCVVRVISPRTMDAALGTGGTRIELWLPSLPDSPVPDIAPRGNQ